MNKQQVLRDALDQAKFLESRLEDLESQIEHVKQNKAIKRAELAQLDESHKMIRRNVNAVKQDIKDNDEVIAKLGGN